MRNTKQIINLDMRTEDRILLLMEAECQKFNNVLNLNEQLPSS